MLSIVNDGEIDIAALTLMGATSKDGDSSKIGFFGSGNKYAMATLLRHGVDFVIWSGNDMVNISTKPVEFRGTTYEQIFINSQPTSLTTRLGPEWEVWFALREFICNAMDEGGFALVRNVVLPHAGFTTIHIDDSNQDVRNFLDNYGAYVLEQDRFKVGEYGQSSFYLKRDPGKTHIYRKGICIIPDAEKTQLKTLFDYNLDDVDINESRVYKYEYQLRDDIARVLANTNSVTVVREVVDARDTMESKIYWDYMHFSQTWFEALNSRKLCLQSFKEFLPPEDFGSYLFLLDNLAKALHKQFPTLRINGLVGETNWVAVPGKYPAVAKARKKLADYGYALTSKVSVGKFPEKETIAQYITRDNKILLSKDWLEVNLEETLLEEHFHSQGYRDGSREFEQFLIVELLQAKRECAKLNKIKNLIQAD